MLNETENIITICTSISYQTFVVSPTCVISEMLLSKDMLAELAGLEKEVRLLFIILAIGYSVFAYLYLKRDFFICQYKNTQYSNAWVWVFLLVLLVDKRTSEQELGGI
jgi:hypothetical protein